MTSAIIKILIGAVLVIGSVWWVLQGSMQYLHKDGVQDFLTLLNGGLPPLVFLLGIFIVWLELDELRIESELSGRKKK